MQRHGSWMPGLGKDGVQALENHTVTPSECIEKETKVSLAVG